MLRHIACMHYYVACKHKISNNYKNPLQLLNVFIAVTALGSIMVPIIFRLESSMRSRYMCLLVYGMKKGVSHLFEVIIQF